MRRARALAAVVGLLGCVPASAPETSPSASASAGPRPRADCALPADGHITGTVVVGERCDVVVPDLLKIEGRLEIRPGATLRFPGCRGLLVLRGGSLSARGTEAARVTLAAADPPCSDGGAQGGYIDVSDQGDAALVEAKGVALDLQLEHVDLVGASDAEHPRVVVRRPAALSFDHADLGRFGLRVLPSIGRVRLHRVRDNRLGMVEVPAPLVTSIDASNRCGADDPIHETFVEQLRVQPGALAGRHTWAPRAYVVAGDLSLARESSLKLAPGTQLRFAAGARFDVEGDLEAEGVTLAAFDWQAPWQRMLVLGRVDLRDTTVRDAADPQGALWMYGEGVSLSRVTFESTGGPAIWPATANGELCERLADPARGNVAKGTPFCGDDGRPKAPKPKRKSPKPRLPDDVF